MHIFFVRHGQTALSNAAIHQSPNTPLSPQGNATAKRVAHLLLRKKNIEKVMTSDDARAVQTAAVIGNAAGVEITHVPDLCDVRRPAALYGRSHYHLRSLSYALLTCLHHASRTWRYNDGESVADVAARACHVKALLEQEARQGTRAVAVVTHAMIIAVVRAHLRVSPPLFRHLPVFSPFFKLPHGSIVAYEVTCAGTRCVWKDVGTQRLT